MAHSFTRLVVHAVWTPHERFHCLTQELIAETAKYVSGILKNEKGSLLNFGGYLDHVHMLADFPVSKAPSDVMRAVKAGSSRWLARDKELTGFAWQRGYSLGSVSHSRIEAVMRYIDHQEEHHRHKSFEDELREFRKAAGMPEVPPAQSVGFTYEEEDDDMGDA